MNIWLILRLLYLYYWEFNTYILMQHTSVVPSARMAGWAYKKYRTRTENYGNLKLSNIFYLFL